MTDHAKLSPSSAHRWVRCPGSVRMEMGYPDSTNINAETGSAAHELGAECLMRGNNTIDYLGTSFKGYEHIEVDREMVMHVQTYVDEIRSRAHNCEMLIEQRVDFSPWVPNGFGTSDTILLGDGIIEVHDLKYGMKKVDAFENEQLLLYALGAYHKYSALSDYHTVRVAIHQPRLDHISEWEITVQELLEFGEKAKACAEATLAPDAGLVPGEKQCQWCKASGACAAYAEEMALVIGSDFDALTDEDSDSMAALDPDAISDEHLPAIYKKLEFIENWCKTIRSRMYAALDEGREIKGYKMVAGKKGNRKFRDEELAEALMKKMRLKVSEMYDQKLKSPSSLEKALKKDYPRKWEKIQQLIVQAEGKPTIALENDKRPAVGNKADDFETIH